MTDTLEADPVAPAPLAPADIIQLRYLVSNLMGALGMLDEISNVLKNRIGELQVRSQLSKAHTSQMLIRRAEASDLFEGIVKRGRALSAQVREIVKQHPEVFPEMMAGAKVEPDEAKVIVPA